MHTRYMGIGRNIDFDALHRMLDRRDESDGRTDFERLFEIADPIRPGDYEIYDRSDLSEISARELQSLVPFPLPPRLSLLEGDVTDIDCVFYFTSESGILERQSDRVAISDSFQIDKFEYEGAQ